ncbi:hypothetical protein CVV38_04345 [Candidatus Peregrinibacteria bacterium HGW-Peregrinibacteria-1]|jgi:hypothetical protein|nr:MAG: hypothetical protein CVV38_04345 [Candidatus Peregrinibacteria bacterium HGW-Peregrinibacteria-1]
MKQYTDLKKQVQEIIDANNELKDDKLSLIIRMLESTAKRIEKLSQEKIINTPENKFYLHAYTFYGTAAMIRLKLLNKTSIDTYEIPSFNSWEDIDNIFYGFADKLTVIVYSNQYELPEESTGSYMLTENGLKIIFANSPEELASLKKDDTVVLHVTNSNLW